MIDAKGTTPKRCKLYESFCPGARKRLIKRNDMKRLNQEPLISNV